MRNYFLIPEDAFRDLTKLELAVYGIINRFERANRVFTGSDDWLVKRLVALGFKTREQSVNRALRNLRDLGYVTITKNTGDAIRVIRQAKGGRS